MRLVHASAPLVVFVLAACTDKPDGGGTGDVGGSVVIATGGTVVPLAPPMAQDATTRNIADQVYDRLARIGDDLDSFGDKGFTPQLAERWSWSADSLSIAFAIDPDARWHDGRPVRAADVKFSFDLIKDPRTASAFRGGIGNVDSVSMSDSLTAVVWFRERSPQQFYDIAYQMHVLPEHILGSIARDQLGSTDMSQRFIGSGRFRMARFEPGVRVELVADTANYRGRPKLDRVIWAMNSDAGSAITQLLSGQADVYENLPADFLPQVDSSGRVRADRLKGLGTSYLGMNQRDAKRPALPHPIFGDVRVRRAISMALDRHAMLRNVFDTVGTLMNGPLPRALTDTGLQMLPFDRARASALLDSAGWRAGTDGIRARNGRPLAFSVLVPTTSRPRMRYAVLIQEQLKAIGARVTIDAIEIRAFIDRQEKRDFDAALMSFSYDPTFGGIKQYWATSSLGAGGTNYLTYSNPTVDAAFDSALATRDPARRRDFVRRSLQGVVDDAPAVWLYEVLAILGVNKRIRTTGLRADGWWAGLGDWWIPEGERIDRDRIGLRPAQP